MNGPISSNSDRCNRTRSSPSDSRQIRHPASNPRSNKPSYTIDARGFRTNFNWDNTTGVLLSTSQGWNSTNTACQIAGNECPSTTFSYTNSLSGYDPLNGVAWGSLSLLAGRTEAISATDSTTTSFGYALKDFSPSGYAPMSNASLKRVLAKEVLVDGSGLALRSCYTYDPAGNLISEKTPRAQLGVCP